MTTATAERKHPLLITGKPVRFRLVQVIYWGTAIALFGAAIIAGLYFNVLEMPWHIPFGPDSLQDHVYTLKAAWDGWNPMPRLGKWTLFRHGYRNDGEPALSTLFVLVITASGGAYVGSKMSGVRLWTTPFLFIVAAFVLITAAVWLQFYGLPDAWHHLFGHHHIYNSHLVKAWAVLETALFGVIVGRLLKFLWKPIACHLQTLVMELSVDHYFRSGKWVTDSQWKGHTPLWVRFPLAPPGLRETWSETVRKDMESGEAEKLMRETESRGHKRHRRLVVTLVLIGGLVLVYLAASGIIAHYLIGTGHYFPYMVLRG